MGLTLGDILIFFRAQTSDVDAAFARIERQGATFANRIAPFMEGRFTGDTSDLQGRMGQAEGAIRGWGGRVKGFLAQSLTFPIGNALGGMAGRVKDMVLGSVIGMNASLEKSTIQFTTLMGDADKAKAHVMMLFEFAKSTPFETGPIIQASRTLETFGGAVLNNVKNLTTVGDAAAAVSEDISRVSYWYGQMYSDLQGGNPFGDSSMTLQEMGVLTPQVRMQMEAMQRSGATAAQIWDVFTKSLQRFNGAMAAQAMTWEGLTSTISDAFQLSGAAIFRPFFDLAKEALAMLAALLSTPRFAAFVTAATASMQRVGDALRGVFEAVLPLAAMVWGAVEPLLVVAWQWGSGFVEAFANGISAAISVVSDALGGLANLVTSLLEPHSPPKILPDLDTWGLKTAQVWMDGWKDADVSLFTQIGQGIASALQTAVGSGQLAEAKEIPILAQAKAALAELMTKRSSGGTFDETLLLKLKAAAGPAGQAAYDLAEAYLRVDWAGRQVAQAQEELNAVTERYDAIINPLSAELDGVRRRMQGLRDAQRLAQIDKDLATATGADREMLLLERRELALNRQISTEQTAKQQAQQTADAKLKAAEKEQKAQQDALADVEGRQKIAADSVAMAKQQVALMEQAGQAAGATAKAATGVATATAKAKNEAQKLQERVDGLVKSMSTARAKGEALVKPLRDGVARLGSGLQSLVRGSGLDKLAAGIRYVFTGVAGPEMMTMMTRGTAFATLLRTLRVHVLTFGDAARANLTSVITSFRSVFASVRDALAFLATGKMSQGLFET
ncbi:MAG: hypothetical protein WCG26_07350, partial [Chloroflexales bacterium]